MTPLAEHNMHFLKGGGEMGALIRSHDWAQTDIGSPELWPPSLRTTLSIILNSKFPMFLFWGQQLTCFYNDAYRPSLGNDGKHPHILGGKAERAWEEIWHIIKPLIDQVLAGGEATWSENQLIPIYRNGKIEDVYWTFSYSPVCDENGNVAGVLVTCSETTEQMSVLNKLSISEQRFRNLVDSAVVATAVLSGREMKLEIANDAALKIWKKDESILGTKYLEFLPEEQRNFFLQLLYNVFETGEPYITEEAPVTYERGGKEELFYFDFTYKPLNNDHGDIEGIFATGIDVTEKVLTRKKLEESKNQLEFAIQSAELATWDFNPATNKFVANDRLKEWFGLPPHDELDLMQAINSIARRDQQKILDSIQRVLNFSSGGHYESEFSIIHPLTKKETIVQAKGRAYFNEEKIAYRINGILQDVTAQVLSRKKIEESEQSLLALVESAPFPIGVYIGREMRIELANQTILDIWGKGNDVIGKLYSSVLPELDNQKVFEQLDDVFTTGKPFHAKNQHLDLLVNGDLKPFYFNYSLTPLYDSHGHIYGVMNTAADVTDLNVAKLKIEESEKRFRNIADSAPVMIWMAGTDKHCHYFNIAWLNFTGRTLEQEMDNGWVDGVYPEDAQRCMDTYITSFDNRVEFYMEYRIKSKEGEYRWISDKGVPRFTTEGTFQGYIGACMDIHDELTSKKRIKESIEALSKTTKRLELAMEAGKLGSFELDIDSGKLELTLQGKQNFGLEVDALLSYPELIEIILPEDRRLLENAIQVALKNNIPYEIEFRIRWSDESVHWIYAAGIPFYNDYETALQMINVTAEITEQKLFEQALEIQVQERTRELELKNVELEKMNTELNSFAYVSSHDLQEPLRKIQTFSNRILENDHESLSDRGKDYFQRMQGAAKRMQSLIEDLLAYSRTNNTGKVFEMTDLNLLVKEIREDFKDLLQAKNAKLVDGELCHLNVIPFQFRQLLQNLISNALKFSSPERELVVQVRSRIERGEVFGNPKLQEHKRYCHLSISDNGIGFESEYNEKIFEVFQRLHSNREYEGTGIGLAIVKKIVENHDGVITANGELNKGARFDIYIPI